MAKCTQNGQLWAVGVGLAAAAGPLQAIEPADVLIFSREPFSARPNVTLTETYNDNIFSRPDGQDDFVTTISPGINLRVGRLERNFVSFDYTFSQHFYAKLDELDADEHAFDFRTRIRGERLSLSGNDRIQLLSSPIGLVQVLSREGEATPPIPGRETPGGQPTTGDTPTASPLPGEDAPTPVRGGEVLSSAEARNVDRTTYYDSYTLGYLMTEKTSLYLQGSHSTTDYEEGIGLFDISTLRGVGGFGFQAFPKTSLFGEVYYGQTSTEPNFPGPDNPHVDFVGGFLGARGSFTEKISGTVKVGYEGRWFSDGSDAPSSPVADLGVAHRLSEKTSIALNYSRLHDVSVQFARESYTANVVRLGLNQFFGATRKWRASVGGSYGLYDYETTAGAGNREYDLYSAFLNIGYQIQDWLAANLSYNYNTIVSDSPGILEYDVNRVSLGVSVGY